MADLTSDDKPSSIPQTWPTTALSSIRFTYTHKGDNWPDVATVAWQHADRPQFRCASDCNAIAIIDENAIDCIGISSPPRSCELDRLIEASLTSQTRRGYRDDLKHFEAWLGRSIPAWDHEVAEYLADMAQMLKPATLSRRLASISKGHQALGLPSPVSSQIVRAAFRGIRREYGTAQRQAKPLLRDDLVDILDRLPETPKRFRDRALLLIGFAGGFRRSELVGIDVEHIEHVRQGMIVNLPRSKTDQDGKGRKVGIPFGRGRHCPVKSLEAWLDQAGITAGPVFRPVNRHGHVEYSLRLSGEAVSIVVKEAVGLIGFDTALYSGHSLRAGLATSAAMAGVPTHKIRQTTGHGSDSMLSRYIRDGDLFIENASGRLL
ncbi:site-specific integrase [Rhizobium sp.]